MRTFPGKLMAAAAGLGLGLAAATGAVAETYPSRAITMIVPFPPGGITDTSARLMADGMSEYLESEVIVENRPGAGGTVGTGYGAKADADGYTVVFGTTGTLSLAPHLYNELPYDPAVDFEGVHTVFAIRNVVVINPDAPFDTVGELIEYGRANPGKLNFGSAGVGTSSHLMMELFRTEVGIDGVHVPFQGSAPALNELIAGRIDVLFDYLSSSGAHLEAGTLKAIATNGAERLAELPDIPTLAEVGLPGATGGAVAMLVVPDGTDKARMGTLTKAAQHAFETTAMTDYRERTSAEALRISGDEVDAFISRENEVWRTIVENAGVERR